ncbi:MAG: proton-conducting transporter membrane subunit, partial [Planctomycetaceae bacterium]
MHSIVVSLIVLSAGGFVALLSMRRSRLANGVGACTAVLGCLLGLFPAVQVLWTGRPSAAIGRAWDVPFGSFTIELNALSAWFVVPILALSALGAVYGWQYLLHDADRKSLGPVWFHYNTLAAAMLLVVTARNGVLFLVAWEVMALSSYFLVVYEHEQQSVRDAGRTYLIASHLGTAFLLVFFVLLGRDAGSMDFADIAAWIQSSGGFSPETAGVLFVLAVIGFGTKAGFMPLHVWLPEAHPVAPSHVSAVMSGVMIKTGIYGILLALTFLGPPPQWWGWLLIGIGMTSGVLGVLFALAQHDLKRLLAYHSVENIGIISLGLGVGVLGMSLNEPGVAVLGFAGALLHVVNHGVFKGLLFLGAGAVIHGTGAGEIDRHGGLMKRMPVTAVTFLVGAVAISGLPPLNGFVSEFLIYLGSFEEETLSGATGAFPALAVIGSLALIGGLAAACFTKAFGVVFLGEPRTDAARAAHATGWLMRIPMIVLAACCLLIALFASPIVRSLEPVLRAVTGQPAGVVNRHLAAALSPLSSVVTVVVAVLVLIVVLAVVRRSLLSGRDVGESPTWDCGFARPTTRMQYTASSYAQPLADFFAVFLKTRKTLQSPKGLFPSEASLHTHTSDTAMERLYRPLFRLVGWCV